MIGNNKFDESVEEGNLIVEDFDYTEETDSFYTESQFVNLDGDTEKLDITDFVGDLRSLMVDDSEDEVVLDSDDEKLSERKDGKVRGKLCENRHLNVILNSLAMFFDRYRLEKYSCIRNMFRVTF